MRGAPLSGDLFDWIPAFAGMTMFCRSGDPRRDPEFDSNRRLNRASFRAILGARVRCQRTGNWALRGVA